MSSFDRCQRSPQVMPQTDHVLPMAPHRRPANPLQRLLLLRRIEVLTQAMVLILAVAWLKIPLEVVPMSAAIAVLAAVNLLTQWRIHQGDHCSEGEIFAHLAIDVGILALLLYFAGGSANPFVSLFLLPPTLAAAMLPARQAWAMAGVTLIAYTFLIFWKLPLPPPQGDLAQFDALLARATGVPTNMPRMAAALPCMYWACG
jgi:two-component system sensor histidine kinase RegB